VTLTISKLISTLSKVQAAVGDLPVKLKAIEGDAETFLHSVGVELGIDGSSEGSTVTVNHSTTPPADPAPETPADGTNPPTDSQA